MLRPFSGPITRWYAGFLAGDELSSDRFMSEVWRVFLPFVRGMLREWHSTHEEDDILQSYFRGFLRTAQRGGATDIADREELVRYLCAGLAYKVIEYRRRETRQRRGGVRWSRVDIDVNDLNAQAPSPDEVLLVEESVAQAMSLLPSDEHRQIACLKLIEGLSIDEIAMEIGCSPSTVNRRLSQIKKLWAMNPPATMNLD